MRFKPYKVEGEEEEEGIVEGVVKFFVLGVRLDSLVKFPGILVMQYLCFWNWKRVIDPNSWSVVLAGFTVWLGFAGLIAAMILIDGT